MAPGGPSCPARKAPSRRASSMVSPVSCAKKAVVFGHLDSPLGVGRAAQALCMGLEETDWAIERVDIPDPWSDLHKSVAGNSTINKRDAACIRILAFNADHVGLMSRHPLVRGWEAARSIGVWHWELEMPPHVGRSARRLVDEVWVASHFVAKSVKMVLDRPVFVVPPPIVDAPRVEKPRWWGRALERRFTVLVVFDYRSNVERKNPYSAVKAFREAFRTDDGALLIIKCRNAELFPVEHLRLVEAIGDRQDIVIVDEDLVGPEMAWLVRRADVLLSLHRAEGFGLPLAEAASAGTVVLATEYGGPVEFLPQGDACLVPFRLVPIGPHQWPYPASARWAEPDIETAVAVLRRLYASPREVAERGRRLAASVGRALSVEACAGRMQQRLEELATAAPCQSTERLCPVREAKGKLVRGRYGHRLEDGRWTAVVRASKVRRLVTRAVRG